MPRHAILHCVLLALLVAGCASQGGPSPEGGEPQAPGVAADGDGAALAVAERPEKDPRFALPRGEKRTLNIFLGSQTFEYLEDGQVIASGQVSTGSKEHQTPAGDFRVLSKDKDKRSGKYTNYFDQNTPMPYSLQFHGPYFVHEGWLPGYADSHGCVRLHYDEARFVYDRMQIGDSIRVKKDGAARPANPWPDLFPVF